MHASGQPSAPLRSYLRSHFLQSVVQCCHRPVDYRTLLLTNEILPTFVHVFELKRTAIVIRTSMLHVLYH